MPSDDARRRDRLTADQAASLRGLGDMMLSSGREWLFAEFADGTYRQTDYLKAGTEGAVLLRYHRPVVLVLPAIRRGTLEIGERRLPAGGPSLKPGETGWIGTGSNRFRVREAIVDEDQGVEYAIGVMETGGFHISKLNFDRKFRSDDAG